MDVTAVDGGAGATHTFHVQSVNGEEKERKKRKLDSKEGEEKSRNEETILWGGEGRRGFLVQTASQPAIRSA